MHVVSIDSAGQVGVVSASGELAAWDRKIEPFDLPLARPSPLESRDASAFAVALPSREMLILGREEGDLDRAALEARLLVLGSANQGHVEHLPPATLSWENPDTGQTVRGVSRITKNTLAELSTDGRWLLTWSRQGVPTQSGEDNRVRILEVESLEEVISFAVPEDTESVAFAVGDKAVLAAGPGSFTLYRTEPQNIVERARRLAERR